MQNINRFNLDLTGTNINNRIVDEPHTLPNKEFRSIAPIYGPYYTESLTIVDTSNAQPLTRDIHYKCLDVVGIPTAQSGKEICTIIVITAPSVGNNVLLNYQALGGDYERTHEAIKKLVDNLLMDNRPTRWPNIINRPTGFNPSHHLHRIGDVYGFEYLVVELERLKNAILLGDEIAHIEILNYLHSSIDALYSIIENTQNLVSLMAVTSATDANSSSATALQIINTISNTLQSLQSSLNGTIELFNDVAYTSQTSESRAINLIQSYS